MKVKMSDLALQRMFHGELKLVKDLYQDKTFLNFQSMGFTLKRDPMGFIIHIQFFDENHDIIMELEKPLPIQDMHENKFIFENLSGRVEVEITNA